MWILFGGGVLMVSIEDVAKEAGVSIATVSRVLNGSGYVSEETELKVLQAMKKLGYRPSLTARALAKKKIFNVGVLISTRIFELLPTELGEFYRIMISAIENSAEMYRLDVRILNFETEEIPKMDGYIIVGSDMEKEQIESLAKSSKVVLLDHYIEGLRVDSIVSDGYDGVYFVTELAISSGFNTIAHLHGPLKYFGFRDRYNGYIAAMTKYGRLPITMEYDELHEDVETALRKLFRDRKPDLIICSNDVIALQALKKLQEWGVRIPEDVSVVGFDDIPSAAKNNLSTLRVQKSEMGLNAVKRLFELLNHQSTHPYKQCVYATYVKRGSSLV